jgi:DNA/RNA-binding domain of Phe-tRNA-synthetase-like protein
MAIIRYTDADRVRMRKEQEETLAVQAELSRLYAVYAGEADRSVKSWGDLLARLSINPWQRRTD